MKKFGDWYFPDHEKHLVEWLGHSKNRGVILHGRVAYQGRKQQAALKYCKQRRTAIDVGAHCGTWSFNLAHEFGNVLAFEPVAEHRECFRKNTAGLTNIMLKAMALGIETGTVSIETEKGSSGNSAVGGFGEIPMAPLDSICDADDVDFIKIDVEGFEQNVVRGAEKLILRCKPVIVVEQKRAMHERFNLPHLGAVKFLQGLGYVQAEEISGDHIMVMK